MPARPAAKERIKLSVNNWETSRARRAPRALRRENSFSRSDSREDEIGDIHTGNQKQENDSAAEQEEQFPTAADQLPVHGNNGGCDFLFCRTFLSHARGNDIEFGLRLLPRDVWLQTRDDEPSPGPPIVFFLVRSPMRRPKFRIAPRRGIKARRHDSDNLVGLPIQRNPLAENFSIGRELLHPHAVAENCTGEGVRSIVGSLKGAAQLGWNAQNVEKTVCDILRIN
jgi:hypothetical protein